MNILTLSFIAACILLLGLIARIARYKSSLDKEMSPKSPVVRPRVEYYEYSQILVGAKTAKTLEDIAMWQEAADDFRARCYATIDIKAADELYDDLMNVIIRRKVYLQHDVNLSSSLNNPVFDYL